MPFCALGKGNQPELEGKGEPPSRYARGAVRSQVEPSASKTNRPKKGLENGDTNDFYFYCLLLNNFVIKPICDFYCKELKRGHNCYLLISNF